MVSPSTVKVALPSLTSTAVPSSSPLNTVMPSEKYPSSGVTFTVTSVPTSTARVMSSMPSKESLPCWVSESETVASSGSAAYAATGANALSMELAMSTADMTLAVMRLPSSLRFTRLILQKIRSMKDSFLDCLVVCLIAISNRSCSRRYRPRHPRRPPRCHLRPRPR
ncbi:Uncharacterised protein [Tyzzerella nexilis]|uniref:Uncharacterized protein n=1 Tax=[Clostridium] nexile TaxID=29361 RepID=A0A6N2UXR8_9FIRM